MGYMEDIQKKRTERESVEEKGRGEEKVSLKFF